MKYSIAAMQVSLTTSICRGFVKPCIITIILIAMLLDMHCVFFGDNKHDNANICDDHNCESNVASGSALLNPAKSPLWSGLMVLMIADNEDDDCDCDDDHDQAVDEGYDGDDHNSDYMHWIWSCWWWYSWGDDDYNWESDN